MLTLKINQLQILIDVYKRQVQFFEQPLDPNVFAKVVLVKEDGELVPLEGQDSMEKIKMVRTNAKKKVFVTNAIRSLAKVSPTGNVRDIEFVVLVGGSAVSYTHLDVYKRQA